MWVILHWGLLVVESRWSFALRLGTRPAEFSPHCLPGPESLYTLHHHDFEHNTSQLIFAHIMSWRDSNKTLQILNAAEKGQYGVIAAIV